MNLMQILTNENPILIRIITIMFSLVQAFLFYRLFSLYLNIDDNKRNKLLFIIIMTIGTTISLVAKNSLIRDFISLFSFIFSVIFLFKQSVKNTFIALVLSYFVALVSEFIADSLIIYVFKTSTEHIHSVPLCYFAIMLFEMILIYLFIIILHYSKGKSILANINIPMKAATIINLILGTLTMILETYLFSTHMSVIPLKLTIMIIVSTFVYFIISMYTLVRTNILEKTEEDLENEKIYNKTLTLLHDNIRGFKHDFNNIVQAIGGYVALNDMNGLKEYYQHLLEECKLTNNLNLLNPEAINNPSIYSLLTNKYFIATEKGITMKFSIFSDLSKINFSIYEISRIMGILLDNAIEAAEESKDKIVDIEFKSDSKKQLFIIKNTCKDTNISTTKIFEKGYSTKNRNSGFGLWNVHKILSKNTNLDLYTSIEDNMFSQQFAVYY